MKARLAIAVAAAATLVTCPVWAQSTVQIYGIVDAGLMWTNNNRVGTGANAPTGDIWRIESGNASTSRLGFRGREDLGGGLAALFVLEQGLAADTATLTSGGRAWGRSSYVGLEGPWGQLQLGRQTTMIYDYALTFDPVAPAKFAGPIYDAAYIARADNAIKYFGKFGPFVLRSQFSFGYDSTIANGGELQQFRVGKEAGVEGEYVAGPLALGLAADRQNGTSVATQGDSTKRYNVGATYQFPGVKLFGSYQWKTAEVAGVSTKTSTYWVGARINPMERLTVSGAVYVNDPQGGSNRSFLPTIFTTYDLSKRTDIYMHLAYIKNQSNTAFALASSVNPGSSQSGVTLGLRHRF